MKINESSFRVEEVGPVVPPSPGSKWKSFRSIKLVEVQAPGQNLWDVSEIMINASAGSAAYMLVKGQVIQNLEVVLSTKTWKSRSGDIIDSMKNGRLIGFEIVQQIPSGGTTEKAEQTGSPATGTDNIAGKRTGSKGKTTSPEVEPRTGASYGFTDDREDLIIAD